MNDLQHQKFGKLLVIRKATDEEIQDKSKNRVYWLCKCDCGNFKVASSSDLKCCRIQSCGCLKFYSAQKRRKTNRYDLSGEYGIGLTSKGEKFLFDKDDIGIIYGFCWRKRNDGYFDAKVYQNHRILLHNLITGKTYVDHKNGNLSDNRKENLRSTDKLEYKFNSYNQMNKIRQKNNRSGVTGVYKKDNKWVSILYLNNNRIYLGSFNSFDEAVLVRKQAENEYFSSWSFDNSRSEVV